nr:MAG TPA: hypothetical protein [Caudoviricetes sp.]
MFRGGSFCLIRSGVLMPLCGLLLLGGIGTPPPMQHAVRCALARFAAALWCGAVCGRPAFPVLTVAAWALPGPGCYSAGGLIPGETVRAVRLRAWSESSGCAHAPNLAVSRRKSLRKSLGFARKSLIVAKPCINPGKSLPILRKLLNSR